MSLFQIGKSERDDSVLSLKGSGLPKSTVPVNCARTSWFGWSRAHLAHSYQFPRQTWLCSDICHDVPVAQQKRIIFLFFYVVQLPKIVRIPHCSL